ncbi:MAG: alpha/beta fold hydrolase [Planctomycetes bacterium]|nr:alpha/beta fold hydrolase [Planctomycetota bacterium]
MSEPLTTYLELRQSSESGAAVEGLSHKAGGLFLLHVLEIAAQGEPRAGVTLVHDAGDHGARHLDTARFLAAAHFAVALPDLRGHGKSEGERGHSAGFIEVARDLDAVQDHLAYRLPVAPKVQIGIGLGALYAASYALEKPGHVAALVLVAPRWRPRFELPANPGGLMKLFKKLSPSAAGRIGNDPACLLADARAASAWSADPLVHDVITVRAAQEAQALAARVEARLRELRLPVLIVCGTDDRYSDVELNRSLAHANIEVHAVAGARHDVLHDLGWETTLDSIAKFLERALG